MKTADISLVICSYSAYRKRAHRDSPLPAVSISGPLCGSIIFNIHGPIYTANIVVKKYTALKVYCIICLILIHILTL